MFACLLNFLFVSNFIFIFAPQCSQFKLDVSGSGWAILDFLLLLSYSYGWWHGAPYLDLTTIRSSFSLKLPHTLTVWSYKVRNK
jgi:hypothetical protein